MRPDGTRVELPDVRTAWAVRIASCPMEPVWCTCHGSHPRDFWLLDFATNKTRALTRLSVHGRKSAFDITPDGKEIVFDRIRTSSDIVLIDLPK